MMLLISYAVFIFVGGALSAGLGVLVEFEWGDVAGLSVFLSLYFISLWIGWIIAVRLTAPRAGSAESTLA